MSVWMKDVIFESPSNNKIILIVGDFLVMLLFVLVGRSSHSLLNADIQALMLTAAPFLFGWFIVTPWFGLFTAAVSLDWQALLPRLIISWAIGGTLALILRTLLLGRPVPAGIIPSFAIAAMGFSTLFMVIWRLGYLWWMRRANA
jgi:hypothetical protein